MIGAVVAGLALAAVEAPTAARVVSSARSFGQHFRATGDGSMSSLERFVVSLVLTHTEAPAAKPGTAVNGRT
jgi:hypothetical protein